VNRFPLMRRFVYVAADRCRGCFWRKASLGTLRAIFEVSDETSSRCEISSYAYSLAWIELKSRSNVLMSFPT
jgi:hypothetical protein